MTLFSLMISLVNRELVFAVDSTRQPWLNFQRWFLVLQWLSFCWRFMDQHWHSVFDDSMRQNESIFAIGFMRRSWILLTLSTPYVSCHSYFRCDFKVYGDSVFADDFWPVGTQFSLTIPCVNDDSVFSNDFTRQPWISIRCQFYQSAVTQFSKMISRSTVSQFSLMIPCVNDDSVFSIDFIRQPWISIRCRFHPSPLTKFSKMISRSTVTQFLMMIYV